MKYRRKDNHKDVVEAVQHFADMGTRTAVIPVWLIDACVMKAVEAIGKQTFVHTADDRKVEVHEGDWIIKHPEQGLYSATNLCFNANYELCPTKT